jgi:hypothetical protein
MDRKIAFLNKSYFIIFFLSLIISLFSVQTFAATPDRVVIISGNNQSGPPGQPLPELLQVEVVDENNKPIPFTEVRFTVLAGGGKVTISPVLDPVGQSTLSTNTNLRGRASVTLIVGGDGDVNLVEARAWNVNPAIFTANVTNSPPVLAPIGNKQINEGSTLQFTVTATDPDPEDTVTLSASGVPTNATFNPSNGVFSFSPNYNQSGTYSVKFTASDGSLTDTETITITVVNVNRPPVLNQIGNRIINENQKLTINITANDPDGDDLTFTGSNIPSGAVLNQQPGSNQATFQWTPGYDTVTSGNSRDFQVNFTVRDTSNASDSEQITITVVNVEQPTFPDIRLSTTNIDFGTVDVGQPSNRLFRIYNDGDATLEIDNITTTDPQFNIIEYSENGTTYVPVTYSNTNPLISLGYPDINPGLNLWIKARFIPSSQGQKSAQFLVASNDPDEPLVLISLQGSGTQAQEPEIRVDPTNINFGSVEIGQSLDKNLKIYNDGGATLQIFNIVSSDPQFTVSSYSNVGPSSNITVKVNFEPVSQGVKTGTLSIITNDLDEPVLIVALQGTGTLTPVPDIRLSTSSLDFGEVQLNNSLDKSFQIFNDGGASLQISSITSSSSHFSILPYNSNVGPGAYINVTVRFAPLSTGTKVGNVTVKSNDPDESTKILSVQGRGVAAPVPDIRLSTSSINFGEVQIGNSSDKTFNIYNDGNAILTISSIVSNNAQFTILGYGSVAPGGMSTVTVRFSPVSVGTKTGNITITSNDPDEPTKSLSVQGIGVTVPVPDIRISPESLVYGDVPVGDSLDKAFKIYNDGNSILQISSITSNSSHYSVQGYSNVAPGSFIIVIVRFTPLSTGTKTGNITIKSNDPDESTETVSVQGIGVTPSEPEIRLSTTNINFGEVAVGRSLDKTFRIYNDGNGELQISSITSNSNHFSVLPYTEDVDPGSMITVTVRFAPLSYGDKTGTITINSNDLDEPTRTVSVYGEGVIMPLPEIRLSTSSIDFGDVAVNYSLDESFKIYNDGDAVLEISSITSSNTQFDVLGYSNVDPDDMITVTIRFTPVTPGTKTGKTFW